MSLPGPPSGAKFSANPWCYCGAKSFTWWEWVGKYQPYPVKHLKISLTFFKTKLNESALTDSQRGGEKFESNIRIWNRFNNIMWRLGTAKCRMNKANSFIRTLYWSPINLRLLVGCILRKAVMCKSGHLKSESRHISNFFNPNPDSPFFESESEFESESN